MDFARTLATGLDPDDVPSPDRGPVYEAHRLAAAEAMQRAADHAQWMVKLIAEHPDTDDLIEAAGHRMHALLGEAGVALAQFRLRRDCRGST